MWKKLLEQLRNPSVVVPIAAALVTGLIAIIVFLLTRNWQWTIVAALAVALVITVSLLLANLLRSERVDRRERGIAEGGEIEQQWNQSAAVEGVKEGFQRAQKAIRSSRLGAKGMQEFPWVLVLGETGAGKSAVLRESGLQLPAEHAQAVGQGPTAGCDWWLTNEAVAIDTAGRFFASEDKGTRREWRTLLRLLRRARSKCPITGVIFTISVPELLAGSQEDLEAKAFALRRRINDLEDQLQVDVPIYVVVSKCDLIEGFVELANALPRERRSEAFGWTNDLREIVSAGEVVAAGLGSIPPRLESLIPELLLRATDRDSQRRIFAFPQELAAVSRAVSLFAEHAFAPSLFDRTPGASTGAPFLRGVYFTSAQREGVTVSSYQQALASGWLGSPLDGRTDPGGIFLLELLRDVVVPDADLAHPLRSTSRLSRRIVHAVAAAAAISLMVWWGFAFADHFGAIRSLDQHSEAVVGRAGGLPAVEHLRTSIHEAGGPRSYWARAWLGGPLDASVERAKALYVWAFGREFERPAKARLLESVSAQSEDDAFKALMTLAQDVLWIRERADEEKAARPVIAPYAGLASDTDRVAFSDAYDDFIRWSSVTELTNREEAEHREVAQHAAPLLDRRNLERFFARNPAMSPPITYEELGFSADSAGTELAGVYRRETWDGLVKGLLESVARISDPESRSRVERFRREYAASFETAWRNFLIDAPSGGSARTDPERAPHLRLLDRTHWHTLAEVRAEGEEIPPWILALRNVRREEALEGEEEGAPWELYQRGLDAVQKDVQQGRESSAQALTVARKMVANEPTSFSHGLELARELADAQDVGPREKQAIRTMLTLPVLDAASAVLDRATSELDERWERDISREYSGTLGAQQMSELYRQPGGKLAVFREQELGRFYARGSREEVIGGRSLPLGSQFLQWMRSAERLERSLSHGSVSLRFTGIPAQVESGPGIHVARQTLELVCDSGIQRFDYRQGVASESLRWTPDCTELSLRVSVVDGGATPFELTPRYRWEGPLAVTRFFSEAQRESDRRFLWRLRFENRPVHVAIAYEVRGVGDLPPISDSPPASIRR